MLYYTLTLLTIHFKIHQANEIHEAKATEKQYRYTTYITSLLIH